MTACTLPGSIFERSPHPPAQRRGVIAAIILAHVLLLWALARLDVIRTTWSDIKPLMVVLVQPESPPPAPPPPQSPPVPAPPLPRAASPVSLPSIVVAALLAPSEPAVVSSAPPVSPVAVGTAPQPTAAPTPTVAVPAPPSPKLLPATAVRYLVAPPIEVPMASRRLGETGTVLLRVLVDPQGLPRQVTLHRSSGFARLDEQALAAMRQARFQPQTDNGQPVEWLVIAPLQYDID